MYGSYINSLPKSLTHVRNPIVAINRKSAVYTQICTLFSPHWLTGALNDLSVWSTANLNCSWELSNWESKDQYRRISFIYYAQNNSQLYPLWTDVKLFHAEF